MVRGVMFLCHFKAPAPAIESLWGSCPVLNPLSNQWARNLNIAFNADPTVGVVVWIAP